MDINTHEPPLTSLMNGGGGGGGGGGGSTPAVTAGSIMVYNSLCLSGMRPTRLGLSSPSVTCGAFVRSCWTQPWKRFSWYIYRMVPYCVLLSTQTACTYCYLVLTHLLRPHVTATHVYPPSRTTVQFLLAESWREPTEQDNFTTPSGTRHNASLRPSWITGPSSTVLLPEQTHNVQISSTVPTLRI